jgi:hypothetical protein
MNSFKDLSYLKKLEMALMVRFYDEEMNDTRYYVLGRKSSSVRFSERKWEYVIEINKVIEQMEITYFMLEHLILVSDSARKRGWRETELIPYYQGVFLSLLHRLKEKIFQIVNLLHTDNVPKNPSREKTIKLKALKEIISSQNTDLFSLLDVWDAYNQDNKSGIKIALLKRTDYQHYVDKFYLDKNLVDLKSARTMLNPNLQGKLSENGINLLLQKEKKSSELLQKEALRKMSKTLIEAKKNVESIAKNLIKACSLNVTTEEFQSIVEKMTKRDNSLKIVNKTSNSKNVIAMRKILEREIEKLERKFGKLVEAIYFVGSLPRGDYNKLFSDINFVIVKKDSCSIPNSIFPEKPSFNVKFFKKSEFFSEENHAKKYRFICWADGICLFGNNLINGREFPQPGLDLALLLNYDIFEEIKKYNQWLENSQNAASVEIGKMSKTVAKRYVDILFAIAMTNEPFYTSNRLERLEWIDKVFPENVGFTKNLRGILFSLGIEDFETLKILVESLEEEAGKNVRQMMRTHKELDEVNKKSK